MSQLSMEGVLTMTIDEQLTELRPSKMRGMVLEDEEKSTIETKKQNYSQFISKN